jgi:hypothetical protein
MLNHDAAMCLLNIQQQHIHVSSCWLLCQLLLCYKSIRACTACRSINKVFTCSEC